MTKLVCIKNPEIMVIAPDELIMEVGGNCWQVGGPQPITYPKHLWRKEDSPSIPSNLDEAAGEYEDWVESYSQSDFPTCVSFRQAFKAGAEWMASQYEKIEGELVDWYSTSDGTDYCCGIRTDESFEVPKGFYIKK